MHPHIPAVAAVSLLLIPLPSVAGTPIGHKVSISRYGGNPSVGKLFKLVARAGADGNPESFPLPGNPAGTASFVIVERDGGALIDSLTAGAWKGLGNPAGSRGWKYRNSSAPVGGTVKILLVKSRVFKLVARSTGTMPLPVATNGDIRGYFRLGGEDYCSEAVAPHDKEIAGKIIKSRAQQPPGSCAIACPIGPDADGDGLPDCVESNTGIFVDDLDTGTDPANPDTDADGIDDGDEVHGTAGGLDLPGLGVSPLRRDILVEYDWFDDSLECGAHSHQPSSAALNMVTAMFAAAPVLNPDGSTGIHFIHDAGQGGLLTGGSLIADADGVLSGGVGGFEYSQHKEQSFAANRRGYFHYVILPHRYNTDSNSSGQAEIGGDDMIVSLYCAGSDSNVAHTIAHELGHNLFLLHGGNTSCNYKPNYNSVMNYRYQFPGIDTNCTPPGNGVLDYSIGSRLSLDENHLDENVGICGAPPWDWNGNAVIESDVSFDINADDDFQILCGGTLTVLTDYDDWAHVNLAGLSAAGAAPRSLLPIVDCDNPAPY